MSSTAIQIMRLALAAVNGLLFAIGLWWALEIGVLRLRRLRMYLAHLLRKQELAEGTEAEQARREREIDEVRRHIDDYRNDPRNPLRLAFSILVICVALAALVGLIAPPWLAIMH